MLTNLVLFSPAEAMEFGDYLQSKLDKHCRLFILCDYNTEIYCLPRLLNQFSRLADAVVINVPVGEKYKTLATAEYIWDVLLAHQADRNTCLLNLGGGVITDMGGLAASIFKRGISFCHIPTTLMAMVDAAIGGKTGIDFKSIKNQIGSFSNPDCIYIDTEFLRTLPEIQIRSGFAEMIKMALLSGGELYQALANMDYKQMIHKRELIQKSIIRKMEIVNIDPFEKNIRKILNFGHTIGHALESAALSAGQSDVLHGEAIAAGMICELWISQQVAGLSRTEMEDASRMISQIFGRNKLSADNDTLLEFMLADKKNKNQSILFSLLKAIGEPLYDIAVNEEMIMASLRYYSDLRQR